MCCIVLYCIVLYCMYVHTRAHMYVCMHRTIKTRSEVEALPPLPAQVIGVVKCITFVTLHTNGLLRSTNGLSVQLSRWSGSKGEEFLLHLCPMHLAREQAAATVTQDSTYARLGAVPGCTRLSSMPGSRARYTCIESSSWTASDLLRCRQ